MDTARRLAALSLSLSVSFVALVSLAFVAVVSTPSSSARAAGTPDLRVNKANNVGGTTTPGVPFTWSLKVINDGDGDAPFADGDTILSDSLPATGATYGTPLVESITNITGHPNIRCSIVGGDLSCKANGGDVVIGSPAGTFTVSFVVTPTTAGTLANPRVGGACLVDPGSVVAESDEAHNDCSDTVTVTQPNLQIAKSNNVGSSAPVQSQITWTWSVTNTGNRAAAFTAGQVIVRDNLPDVGGTYGAPTIDNVFSVTNSSKIGCAVAGDDLTCRVTDGTVTILAGGHFDIHVTFIANVPGALVNPRQNGACAVDPDGAIVEIDEGDNACIDTIIILGPELQVTKTNDVDGEATVGQSWTWTWTVKNTGAYQATFGSGTTILFDKLPTGGVIYGDPTVVTSDHITGPGQVRCTISNDDLVCVADGGALTIGSTTGAFTVKTTVTPSTAKAFVNPRDAGGCVVDGPNQAKELDESNNTCADTVVVSAARPDLKIGASNTTNDATTAGSTFAWSLTVTNTGTVEAIFGDGQTILTDDLPTDGTDYGSPTLQAGSVGVTGIANVRCTVDANRLTCKANGGSVTIGATTGTLTINLPVTPTVAGQLRNPRVGGACTVDPSGLLPESNETNNDCGPDTVTVAAAPNLQVTRSASTSPAVVGTAFGWTWTIANVGGAPAVFTAGQSLLLDNLPGGATYAAPVVATPTSVVGSEHLHCVVSANDLNCTVSGGSVILGAATGSIKVTVATTPTAVGALASPRTGGACTVDPGSAISEVSESDNGCSHSVTVVTPTDLQVTKSNNVSGLAVVGSEWTWTWIIANGGGSSATFESGTRILTDHLPSSGLTYGTPTVSTLTSVSGPGTVACSLVVADLACTAAGGPVVLAAGGSILVSMSVTPTAAGTFVNPRPGGMCAVDPSQANPESNESNNACTDTVIVSASAQPDLKIEKTNNVGGGTTFGSAFIWALTVSNVGGSPVTFTHDQVIMTDSLPLSGATYGTPGVGSLVATTNGGNIECGVSAGTLSCKANGGAVTIGAATGRFTVNLPVTTTALGTLTNPRLGGLCVADPDNLVAESDESNNTCKNSLTVTAVPVPDLRISITNTVSGATTVGSSFGWALTVINAGDGAATFASGLTILTDHLPSSGTTYGTPTVGSLTNVTGGGSISCGISGNTFACTASGGSVTLGAATGSFRVTVPVTTTAAGQIANPRAGGVCVVDPAGVVAESNEANNACADTVIVASPEAPVVPVNLVPDLQIAASGTGGSVPLGNPVTWTLAVSNVGSGPATFVPGQTILADHLPSSGAAYGTPTVSNLANVTGAANLRCAVVNNALICTASGGNVVLGAGSGAFTVALPVTPTAIGVLDNPVAGGFCAVDPDNVVAETSEGNNTCRTGLSVTRPTVRLAIARGAQGTLRVTITATGDSNALRAIRIGTVRNATVQVAGQTGATGLHVSLPSFPTSVELIVTRARAGESVLVPLEVVDAYGSWSTFVGGGLEAF